MSLLQADEAAKALATQRQEVNKFHSSLDRLKDMVQKSKDACKCALPAACMICQMLCLPAMQACWHGVASSVSLRP